MDTTVFFNEAKRTIFTSGFQQPQVDGLNSLFEALNSNKVANPHHAANILAEVHHETATWMFPIKETVMPYHKDKNPSDAEVKRRLDVAFAKGQLSWVKENYWRDGWFGRGGVQLTHKSNYEKMSGVTGVDLVANPEYMMDPDVSAMVAVKGMLLGSFTGRKLSDYSFPAALDAPWDKNPRRIINGKDGTDGDVAKTHRLFYNALVKAGYTGLDTVPATPSTPQPQPEIVRTKELIIAEMRSLVDELAKL